MLDWLNNACLGVSQCSFSIICFLDDIVVVGEWNEGGVDCELGIVFSVCSVLVFLLSAVPISVLGVLL